MRVVSILMLILAACSQSGGSAPIDATSTPDVAADTTPAPEFNYTIYTHTEAAGLTGLLARTGLYQAGDESRGAPDGVLDSVADLPAWLQSP